LLPGKKTAAEFVIRHEAVVRHRFGEIPRSGSSLGTAILIGLPILRSIGRKCQTAEVCFSEGERADQPPLICRPQPGELKEQLRDSLGKGSAARHGAQCECGIC
jgi:hypothetical protein